MKNWAADVYCTCTSMSSIEISQYSWFPIHISFWSKKLIYLLKLFTTKLQLKYEYISSKKNLFKLKRKYNIIYVLIVTIVLNSPVVLCCGNVICFLLPHIQIWAACWKEGNMFLSRRKWDFIFRMWRSHLLLFICFKCLYVLHFYQVFLQPVAAELILSEQSQFFSSF